MVEKSKIKIDPKKALEKLIVDETKKIKEKDKKSPANENDKKVDLKEDKKQKIESKKLEEVIVNTDNAGVDLKNLGLVQTNTPIMTSAPDSKLENSVKNVSIDSDKKKDQIQAYSSVKDNYIQQQSKNYDSAKNNSPATAKPSNANRHFVPETISSISRHQKNMRIIQPTELMQQQSGNSGDYKSYETERHPQRTLPGESPREEIRKYRT